MFFIFSHRILLDPILLLFRMQSKDGVSRTGAHTEALKARTEETVVMAVVEDLAVVVVMEKVVALE